VTKYVTVAALFPSQIDAAPKRLQEPVTQKTGKLNFWDDPGWAEVND